jgi:hypothetical protein
MFNSLQKKFENVEIGKYENVKMDILIMAFFAHLFENRGL